MPAQLFELLPYLLPLLAIQLTLAIIALVSVLKQTEYKIWNRTIWILIVIFVNIFGPIAYFVWGKKDV